MQTDVIERRPRISENPELIEKICSQLEDGIPLKDICASSDMPDRRTVYHWIENHVDIAQRIARAREIGQETIAEGTRVISRGKGESSGDVQRDKLIIDTDMRLLAVWNPKKYSERKQLDITVTDTVSLFETMERQRQQAMSKVIEHMADEALW